MLSLVSLRFLGLVVCLMSVHQSLLAQGTPATAAQVTFYSTGSFLKAAAPGYKYGKFVGRIMDEYDQLAMLTPGHFVTFNLDPGKHTFSANSWMIPRPEGGGHLEIDLVAGKHYYVGAYLESLVLISTFRMEQRTCEQAQQDNKNSKPLDRKHLRDYGLARVLAETSFPTCP
jgi:hypothetical protein